MPDQQTVQELADQAFGRWAMVIPSKEWLSTSGVIHEPTIDFLRTIGLPVQGRIYEDGTFLSQPATTMNDFLAEARTRLHEEDVPDEKFVEAYGHFIDFGSSANCDTVYLDPRTGIIYGFLNYTSDPYVYCSSVSNLVYFAAYWELHGKVNGVWLDALVDDTDDIAFDAAEAIGRHFAEIDPAANTLGPGDEETLWESIASDGFAAGLFVEWRWNRSSVEYFHQRGINPLTKTPYHDLNGPVPEYWSASAPPTNNEL